MGSRGYSQNHYIIGDLDFADDIYLLAHSYRDIQSKTENLVRKAAKIGLHVKPKQCETTVKQQTQSNSENRVHIHGNESDKRWKFRS